MKNNLFLVLAIIFSIKMVGQKSIDPSKWLVGEITKQNLKQQLLPLKDWMPFPKASDRVGWDTLTNDPSIKQFKEEVIAKAIELQNKPWPVILATDYMDFVRTGNRNLHSGPLNERSGRLGDFVLAECFEGKGRFVDDIVNAIWLICEQTTWEISAHICEEHWQNRLLIPNPDYHFVDIYAVDVALNLAEAVYLLEDQLNELSPYIIKRAHKEIKERIIQPIMERNDHTWWYGLNNHNTWCAAMALGSAMYVIDDNEELATFAYRLIDQIESFIARRYGPKSGWEEGPGYWSHSGGKILLFYDFLYSRTKGKLNPFASQKIADIGMYLRDSHIDGPYFLSFCDVESKPYLYTPLVYRFGEVVNDEGLKSLVGLYNSGFDINGAQQSVKPASGRTGLFSNLRQLFWMPTEIKTEDFEKSIYTWWPGTQEMIARETIDAGQGLVLAGKAAHNHQSHNQNDVGQFMVYYNGYPVVVDLGKGTYNKQVFSSNRFDVWWIRGSGHNAPIINGKEQQNGVAGILNGGDGNHFFTSRNVTSQNTPKESVLSMELSQIYGENTEILEVNRHMKLDRKAGEVTVNDFIRVKSEGIDAVVNMYSPIECSVVSPCKIRFLCGKDTLYLHYNSAIAKVDIIPVELKEKELKYSWGNRMSLITFRLKTDTPQLEYNFTFSKN